MLSELETRLLYGSLFSVTPDAVIALESSREIEERGLTAGEVLNAARHYRLSPPRGIEPASREELTTRALGAINQWKAQQEGAGVEWNGHRFDSDESSLNKIRSVLLLGDNPLRMWTSADNVDVKMEFAQLQQLHAAMVQRGAEIHARQRAMKKSLETLDYYALRDFKPDWPKGGA